MDNLRTEIKQHLITHLNLEDLSIEDIKDDTPLFGNDLGLDSIDALEIIVMLDKQFGIKINNPEDGARVFQTVNTIAEYIEANNS